MDDARSENISNLAILRSVMNPTKLESVSPINSTHEPAIFPTDYFSKVWNLQRNDKKDMKETATSGNAVYFNSFKSIQSLKDSKDYFVKDDPRLQVDDMSEKKKVEVIKVNRHKTFKQYAESVDVKTTAQTAETGPSSSTTKKDVLVVARIPLAPPIPGPSRLEINSEANGGWGTNFGSPGAPLQPGKYKVRVIASGITYLARIYLGGVLQSTLGINANNEVTHGARFIYAKDVSLGESSEMQMGTLTETEITDVVNKEVQGASSAGKGATVKKNGCTFSSDPSTASAPSADPGGVSEVSTDGGTTLTPSKIEFQLSYDVVGVDEKPAPPAPGGNTITVYTQNINKTKITTKTVTTTIAGEITHPQGSGGSCRSACPDDNMKATGGPDDFVWGSMWNHASSPDGSIDTKLVDYFAPVETAQLQNDTQVQGIICTNYQLIAQKIMSDIPGLGNVQDIKYGPYSQFRWAMFDKNWGTPTTVGEAKHLERFYSYVAPSCVRELVGERGDTCGCFDASTQIRMADGSEKAASQIRQGDVIWNPKTERPQLVKHVIAGPEKIPMYRVEAGGNVVTVTNGHPFLTSAGLKAAKDLSVGENIILNDKIFPVQSIETRSVKDGEEAPVVWNFELEGGEDEAEHFVLANGIMTGDLFLQIKLKALETSKEP